MLFDRARKTSARSLIAISCLLSTCNTIVPALSASAESGTANQSAVNPTAVTSPGVKQSAAVSTSDISNDVDGKPDDSDLPNAYAHLPQVDPHAAKTSRVVQTAAAPPQASQSNGAQSKPTSAGSEESDLPAAYAHLPQQSPGAPLKATATADVLKGSVSEDGKKSPLLYGSVQSIPKGTEIKLTMMGNINSEISQKGDEVWVRVSQDVAGTNGVGVPGGWFMHGLVTDAEKQKRLGRNGYIDIEFDKLVSPDGEYELPFEAKVSTKDSMLKSAAKIAAIDSVYVGYGAVGGALLSLQITGIPGAIASQGYSVAIGAGVGATIGGIGALKRKGKIASLYPGDEMKMVTAEPISLPGFDKSMLPSAKPLAKLAGMDITVKKALFSKDPNGDKASSLLTVDLSMANKTRKEYTFCDLAVVSDHSQLYAPLPFGGFAQLQKAVKPNTEEQGSVTFEVDSKKRKYWLVLLDRIKGGELTRVPIN